MCLVFADRPYSHVTVHWWTGRHLTQNRFFQTKSIWAHLRASHRSIFPLERNNFCNTIYCTTTLSLAQRQPIIFIFLSNTLFWPCTPYPYCALFHVCQSQHFLCILAEEELCMHTCVCARTRLSTTLEELEGFGGCGSRETRNLHCKVLHNHIANVWFSFLTQGSRITTHQLIPITYG